MRNMISVLLVSVLLAGATGRLVGDEPQTTEPQGADAGNPVPVKQDGPRPLAAAEAAWQVDKQLQLELFNGKSPETPPANDQLFLRRVSLDLIGRNPTSQESKTFASDNAADKRSTMIDQRLANKKFGENWARYWRDVILARQVDPRAAFVSRSVYSYFTEKFNNGSGWDEIARDFVTAEGDVRENGNTAIYMAQMGRTSETAAEMSRVFMGVQIQCAQCHDHPWDRWKREQFHQFAAFFPRVQMRSIREENRLRGYEVTTSNNRRSSRYRRSGEHYMPNLKNARSRGTLMKPVLFATSQSLRTGASDKDRRESLAKWMTAPQNPWFARAFVNRIWGELVGEGFYEPLDDMGPDRKPAAPQTMGLLTEQFVANGHNVKWLFRTITRTQAYQRDSRPRRTFEETPFAASCPQPLRAEQIYNSLVGSLGITSRGSSSRRSRSSSSRSRSGSSDYLRSAINRSFDFDPSLPREHVTRSIPQTLFLMNSSTLNRAIDAQSRRTSLGRLAADIKDNRALTTEIYQRTLAREPSARELQTCLQYIQQIGDRREAIEDLQWALINSTEFLHRR